MLTRSRLAASAATGVVVPLLAVSSALGAAPMSTGPNSSDSPYLMPVAPGVTNTALLSVGDADRQRLPHGRHP
jgi:hypothetical protein